MEVLPVHHLLPVVGQVLAVGQVAHQVVVLPVRADRPVLAVVHLLEEVAIQAKTLVVN